jgi:hypothetical protein
VTEELVFGPVAASVGWVPTVEGAAGVSTHLSTSIHSLPPGQLGSWSWRGSPEVVGQILVGGRGAV